MMELLFRRPAERVLGRESADEARDRFAHAVDRIVENATSDVVAIVTHGTVLALFLADHGARKTAFELWRSLGQPSFVVMDVPGFEIVEVVERV
jgi:broad specificity phosphatase PhoE